jgi:hypothetical protein
VNPFSFFLAIADKVHTALNLLDPTRTYAAADALWARQRGAERLAEREAQEEVGEPLECDGKCATDECVCPVDDEEDVRPARDEAALHLLQTDPAAFFEQTRRQLPLLNQHISSSTAHLYVEDEPVVVWKDSNIFRSGGQTKEMGPRPRISTPGPRVTDSNRLDHIIALLEKLVAQESSAAPASQTDAPGEASGVPEGVSTPDPDAPSGHLTLGNDPAAIHARALRKRLKEYRSRPTTCCAELHDGTDFCRAPAGHRGEHRGEVWAWD